MFIPIKISKPIFKFFFSLHDLRGLNTQDIEELSWSSNPSACRISILFVKSDGGDKICWFNMCNSFTSEIEHSNYALIGKRKQGTRKLSISPLKVHPNSVFWVREHHERWTIPPVHSSSNNVPGSMRSHPSLKNIHRRLFPSSPCKRVNNSRFVWRLTKF